MAVTIADTVVTLGAPGDAHTLESPLARAKIAAVLVAVGTAPGTVILNDKADGSGNSLATVILKSNVSLLVNPDDGFWCTGGFKANASNPAGSVVTVYFAAGR